MLGKSTMGIKFSAKKVGLWAKFKKCELKRLRAWID